MRFVTFLSWMTAEWPYLALGPLSELAWTSFQKPLLAVEPPSERSPAPSHVATMCRVRRRENISPPTTHILPNSSTMAECDVLAAGRTESASSALRIRQNPSPTDWEQESPV